MQKFVAERHPSPVSADMDFHSNRLDAWRALLLPWFPLWMVVALIAIFMHGPMPMYSTRTLTVAWEMWHRHSFIVPYLNGVPYSDKPPMLFWLIHLGWVIGGVGDVWPRLLEVLFGAAELVFAAVLAQRLFPDRVKVARAVPWVLLAFSYGFLFGLQTMYEVLLAACVLAALLCLTSSALRDAPRFIGFALAIGVGLLSKGPVMLLHVVFPWLLGPLWNDWARREWRRWYAHGALAMMAGCAMLLAWALAAASIGGPAYGEQLLFHQTAGRVVEAFAHARPFWWYVPVLPLLIFPFVLWPRLWVALATLRSPFEPGLRFLFVWLGPVLLVFSLVSGKQPYYLLPECAGFALLIVAAVTRPLPDQKSLDSSLWLGPWPLAVLSAGVGLLLLLLPQLIARGMVHSAQLVALGAFSTFGVIFLMLGVLLMLPSKSELRRIALAGLVGAVVANGLFTLAWWPAFDLKPAAALLARAQVQGRPIANLEPYDGQFGFLGRLTRPIQEVSEGGPAQAWAKAHPQGLLVRYSATLPPLDRNSALYVQPFRGVWMSIWSAKEFAGRPCKTRDPAARTL